MSAEHAPRYLVVEGPIGVGKTTLARRLAQSFGSDLILEMPDVNPFLKQFYQQPRQSALPTQIYFLLQRAQQMRNLRQSDLFKPVQVADFLMDKDRLFAELTLTPEEFNLYQQLYAQLAIDAPVPDLVIYLQAPVDVLMRRIRSRGVDFESGISEEYLQRLSEAYVRFFHRYDASPLFIVNAAGINLADNDADYQALLERVRARPAGRQYLNFSP